MLEDWAISHCPGGPAACLRGDKHHPSEPWLDERTVGEERSRVWVRTTISWFHILTVRNALMHASYFMWHLGRLCTHRHKNVIVWPWNKWLQSNTCRLISGAWQNRWVKFERLQEFKLWQRENIPGWVWMRHSKWLQLVPPTHTTYCTYGTKFGRKG